MWSELNALSECEVFERCPIFEFFPNPTGFHATPSPGVFRGGRVTVLHWDFPATLGRRLFLSPRRWFYGMGDKLFERNSEFFGFLEGFVNKSLARFVLLPSEQRLGLGNMSGELFDGKSIKCARQFDFRHFDTPDHFFLRYNLGGAALQRVSLCPYRRIRDGLSNTVFGKVDIGII